MWQNMETTLTECMSMCISHVFIDVSLHLEDVHICSFRKNRNHILKSVHLSRWLERPVTLQMLHEMSLMLDFRPWLNFFYILQIRFSNFPLISLCDELFDSWEQWDVDYRHAELPTYLKYSYFIRNDLSTRTYVLSFILCQCARTKLKTIPER